MASFDVLAVTISVLGLAASITYYAMILRNQNKTRQTEILFQRHKVDLEYLRSWADVMFRQDWNTLDELNEKYPWDTHFEERTRVLHILNTYNNLGLILKEKVVDPKLVFDLYTASNIITTRKKYEEFLETIRLRSNHPTEYSAFDYLYNEAKKMYPEVITIPSAKIALRN